MMAGMGNIVARAGVRGRQQASPLKARGWVWHVPGCGACVDWRAIPPGRDLLRPMAGDAMGARMSATGVAGVFYMVARTVVPERVLLAFLPGTVTVAM